ncbi:MAG: agmatinase [Desulfocapsa sp.]|nr:agmatinase [Desulfocapsa sp.]
MRFADIPDQYREYHSSKVVILPIPYDGTSTWMKGADLGPQAILQASEHLELYDIETGTEVYRQGICTLDPLSCPEDPKEMVARVQKLALPLFRDNKLVVGLGGEHSISIGLIQAAHACYPDVSVLQLDAHSDLRDSYQDSPYNHACVMARVNEICPSVQVGIRSMDKAELKKIDPDRLVLARNLHLHGIHAAVEALELLSDNVYITIDMDVLDPSYMPATGTPEPGGIDWYMLNMLIQRVAGEKKIVGLDVVELLPQQQNRAPDFLAAKLIYRSLSMILRDAL